MEERDKKERMGRNAAFYAALAVCLIAVGVGTWQLLQPEKAPSGTAAVSSPSLLPDAPEAIGPEAPQGVAAETAEDGGAETPQAVSGAAELPDTPSDAQSVTGSGEAQAALGGKGAESSKDADSGKSSKNADNAANAKSADSGKSSKGAESGKGAANAKDADSAKGATGKASGETVRPVEGAVVTGYSMDKLLYNETMRDWRTHDGIDIAAEAGAAVVAAKAGTVESVTADPIMGVTVTIRHEGAWETVYSSLTDAPEAEAGDEVAAGQVIGFVGETAASESALGPHLHFAALRDGEPSDPEAFLS